MTSPQPAPVSREDIPALVFVEEVALVYRAIPAAVVGNSIYSLVLASILWPRVARVPLLAWLAAHALLALARLLLGRAFRRSAGSSKSTRPPCSFPSSPGLWFP